jgi:hypothetical protein
MDSQANNYFQFMPEVKEELDYHLELTYDSSAALRSIYGRFFPWLALIDQEWTNNKIEVIFPSGKFEDPCYIAAWDTLMKYVPLYSNIFGILREKYKEAIHNLGKVNRTYSQNTDRDKKIAEHLMIIYRKGEIELTDDLFTDFWSLASDELRSHALSYEGRHLNSEEDIKLDQLERLKTLWESRILTARTSLNKSIYEKEMAAFGWWFASGKFDNEWSYNQYIEALDIGRETIADHLVVQRLIELVEDMPNKVILILSKLILLEKTNWFVFTYKDRINIILYNAIGKSDIETREATRSLINRLVARGFMDFGNLLDS